MAAIWSAGVPGELPGEEPCPATPGTASRRYCGRFSEQGPLVTRTDPAVTSLGMAAVKSAAIRARNGHEPARLRPPNLGERCAAASEAILRRGAAPGQKSRAVGGCRVAELGCRSRPACPPVTSETAGRCRRGLKVSGTAHPCRPAGGPSLRAARRHPAPAVRAVTARHAPDCLL